MSDTTFYLNRNLYESSENARYSEEEILSLGNFLVVLAEPGAGKTELLKSLARTLGVRRIPASAYLHSSMANSHGVLIIDAFDEVAKLDTSGVYKILGKAYDSGAHKVIISSRSSEWEEAVTHQFEEFFGEKPRILRLKPFDRNEQKLLFENYVPEECFEKFCTEVDRFDLGGLLSNPQFLKLFADAYVESDRHFTSRISIFELAIERLAKEMGGNISSKISVASREKILFAAEIFAKIMLSGATGISTSEINSTRTYPHLTSMTDPRANCILETRLFIPSENADQHEPIHRIVAEYCAAKYLVGKISEGVNGVTLRQILAIIAPNATLRDELRGLLGWMAALGDNAVQEAAIDLDPYAILANGDPASLSLISKRRLLQKLREVANNDPYFRREDMWRTFSVPGFFTADVVNDLRSMLSDDETAEQLKGLLLELMANSKINSLFYNEFKKLMLDSKKSYQIRSLSSSCILRIRTHNLWFDISQLIEEGSHDALNIASGLIISQEEAHFDKKIILQFFHACENLFPRRHGYLERVVGQRYFISSFISKLSNSTTEWLLDALTDDLKCVCGEAPYNCDCRNGMSKIVGKLLDHYFSIPNAPYSPHRLWKWIKNLNFHSGMSIDQSASVREMQLNTVLRQDILRIAFKNEVEIEKIRNIKIQIGHNSHAGLRFKPEDYKFIVDLAFSTNNVTLWSCFMEGHFSRITPEPWRVELRSYMRAQASQKAMFMQAWAKMERDAKKWRREHNPSRFTATWRMRRRRQKKAKCQALSMKYFNDNEELILSGKHFGYLYHFAYVVLMQPLKADTEFISVNIMRDILRNSLDFIEPHIPSLSELARLRCRSQTHQTETILYAACLEIWRSTGSLDEVKTSLLIAFRTNIDMHYSAVSEVERDSIRSEVDRRIFHENIDIEKFLRQYIESQLGVVGYDHAQVSWLRYQPIFAPFQKTLSLEWLKAYRNLSKYALNELFEQATQHADRRQLEELISMRCAEYIFFWPNRTENETLEMHRTFWFVRSFYFLPNPPALYWEWITEDKNSIFILNELSGRMHRNECFAWPVLSAVKIEAILNAFIGKWAEVDLPDSCGSDSPEEEKAYRFLSDVIWRIGDDEPDSCLPVISRLLADDRFSTFHLSLRNIRTTAIRKKALQYFQPPRTQDVVSLLNSGEVATVEGLRALVVEKLDDMQADILGGEFDSGDVFYEDSKRITEVPAALRIADRLRLGLLSTGIIVTPEHQLKQAKRSDFTVSKLFQGERKLLVCEVKGQWHKDLYCAALNQLHNLYSIHPDAEQQGIYIVIWYGAHEKVAGRKRHDIKNADELKERIINHIPIEIRGMLSVVVLDVSRD